MSQGDFSVGGQGMHDTTSNHRKKREKKGTQAVKWRPPCRMMRKQAKKQEKRL
jgi:hypothetical protein